MNKDHYYSLDTLQIRRFIIVQFEAFQLNNILRWSIFPPESSLVRRVNWTSFEKSWHFFFCFRFPFRWFLLNLWNLHLYKFREEVALTRTIVCVSLDGNCTFHAKKKSWKHEIVWVTFHCLCDPNPCLLIGEFPRWILLDDLIG